MLVYIIVISGIILSVIGGYSLQGSGSLIKSGNNQDILGQIIASNLRSSTLCKANLDLAFENGLGFQKQNASLASGQNIKVRVSQFTGTNDASPNEILASGHTIPSLQLKISSLKFSNARLINTNAAIRTYNGMVTLQTNAADTDTSVAAKPVIFLTVAVDTANGNKVIDCAEDISPAATCARYGGVYNATGMPPCSSPAPNITCPAGHLLKGFDSQAKPICISWQGQCPSGTYMLGYKEDMTLNCAQLPPKEETPSTPPVEDDTQPKNSTGVWTVVNHSSTIPCPMNEDGVGGAPDGGSREGQACYALGFQCQELVCAITFGGSTNYTRPIDYQKPCANGPDIKVHLNKRLECQEGTPATGPRPVPKRNLRVSTTGSLASSAASASVPYCWSLKCTAVDQTCKNEVSLFPGDTVVIHKCVEYDPDSPGKAKFVKNISAPSWSMTCNPESLAMTDPRWMQYREAISTVYDPIFGQPPPWCYVDLASKAAGVYKICENVVTDGSTCPVRGAPYCWQIVSSTVIKVYTCE